MPNNNPQQSSSQQSSQRSEGSQKISERVERTAEQATRLADRLGETAEQTANAALQRVRDARMQAQSGIAEQRAQIAERIRRLGGVLRAGSETLSTDDPYAQNLLTTAGDRVERLADYVNDLEPGRIAEDLNALARRRPGLFFGGAFLIGLGLGRFVKSTGKVAVGAARDLTSDYEGGESGYESDYRTTYDETTSREATRSYVATQRDIGVGAESPVSTGTTPSYGSTGSSGTTLPYGVGGSSGGGASTSSFGTGGSSGTGGTSGTSGSSSAFGTSGASEGKNSTSTNTPRESERGQGSKS